MIDKRLSPAARAGALALAALGALPLASHADEWARVVSSTPIVQPVTVQRQVCVPQQVVTRPAPSGLGAVMGAIAGGAIGSSSRHMQNTVDSGSGATTPGPVPQVMWKRGTELPCPPAVPSPRSAQPTTGNHRIPSRCSQARFSPAANST